MVGLFAIFLSLLASAVWLFMMARGREQVWRWRFHEWMFASVLWAVLGVVFIGFGI